MMKKIIDSLRCFVIYPVVWFYVHNPKSILFALIAVIISFIAFCVEDKQTKQESEESIGDGNNG